MAACTAKPSSTGLRPSPRRQTKSKEEATVVRRFEDRQDAHAGRLTPHITRRLALNRLAKPGIRIGPAKGHAAFRFVKYGAGWSIQPFAEGPVLGCLRFNPASCLFFYERCVRPNARKLK
jgi:hypothetical protein